MRVTSDRVHHFDTSPAEVWAAMSEVDAYSGWWPWLDDFDAPGLEAGAQWRCTVRPPLPYALHLRITLDVVEASNLVEASVAGDLTGQASVTLTDAADGGCAVRLVSDLTPTNPVLRAVAAVARPVAHFGHDWVLDNGARQFRVRALGLGQPPEGRPRPVVRQSAGPRK